MPPPPPRRSAKPAGPPPPPPSLPRGQRLAGIFSTPPPPPSPTVEAAPAAVATPAAVEATPAAVEATPAVEAAPAAVEPPPVIEAAPAAVEPPPVIEAAPSVIEAPPPVIEAPPPLVSPEPVSVLSAPPASAEIPKWLVLARQRPVLWMAGLPVILASLLIVVLLAVEPPRTAKPERTLTKAAQTAAVDPAVQAAPAPAAAPSDDPASKAAALAGLEGKPAAALNIGELLLLNEGRAERKRQDAQALSHKLQQQPDLAQDEATQAELLRLAADPDTARLALAAMAQTHSPIGADLLNEVATSRTAAPATAELARSLLQSRDVRPNASPALAAALELRDADSCEAADAAVTKARSDGDRRSLSSLAKLNSRHQCGKKPEANCSACARAQQKQVIAANRQGQAPSRSNLPEGLASIGPRRLRAR